MDRCGTIATIVNGSGLAMSTCDTIDLLHGKCANFLDTGGKAAPETIKEAFRLVLKNPQVNVILVNIFGGLVQGDMIAAGIIAAMKDLQISLPVVARIQGTNAALGMDMLRKAGLNNVVIEENAFNAVKAAVFLSRRDKPDCSTAVDSYVRNPSQGEAPSPISTDSNPSSPVTSAQSAQLTQSVSTLGSSPVVNLPSDRFKSNKSRGIALRPPHPKSKLIRVERASVNRYGHIRPNLMIFQVQNNPRKPYLSIPRQVRSRQNLPVRISEARAAKLAARWLAGDWAPSFARKDIQGMIQGLEEGTLGPNARFWDEVVKEGDKVGGVTFRQW